MSKANTTCNEALKAGIRVVDGVPCGKASPPKYSCRTIYDLLSPMRDGVLLAMDVLRPDAPGTFPVILVRTPYNKVKQRSGPFYEDLVRRGYVVAVQDCRGRFNSDGVFDPYRPGGRRFSIVQRWYRLSL